MCERRSSGAGLGTGASLWLFLAFVAVAAGLHVLFRTAPRGPAVTADGIAMWSAALNLLAGHGLVDFAGQPLTLWPPLLPLLMAAGARVGLDPPDAVRWIHAAAFAATVVVFGIWLASAARRRAVVWGGAVVAAVSYPLGYYAAHMLSETLMTLFLFSALAQLDAVLRGRRGPGAVALAGGFAGLAMAARYPAALLVPFGSAALLLDRRVAAAARLRRAAAFGAIAMAPLAVIVGRNWVVSGTALGNRSPYVPRGALDSLVHAGKALATWAAPGAGAEWMVHLPWIVAAALCSLAVCVMVACPRASPFRRARAPAVEPSIRLFAAFAAVYVGVLFVIVPSWGTHQYVDSRFLLPAFLPALASAALLADRFLRIEAKGREASAKRWLAAALAAGCVAHVAFAIRQNAAVTSEWRDRGDATWGAYNSGYWDRSATLRNAVQAGAAAVVVYSNEAPLLWYHDRTAPPGKYRELPARAEELGVRLAPGSSIVWFDRKPFRMRRYGVSDVLAAPGVRLAEEWEDGRLLRVAGPAPVP